MENTKHVDECKRVFGRYDLGCPRCQELANGSKPRSGWQSTYFAKRRRDDAARLEAIKNHNCTKSGCGPVCTAFDW
jgi:hypothetical protein